MSPICYQLQDSLDFNSFKNVSESQVSLFTFICIGVSYVPLR